VATTLVCVSLVEAADLNLPAQSRSADEKEDSCWKIRYGKCDGVERAQDIVFVFPRDRFKRGREVVARIQASWNLLRKMTGINPTRSFGQRVVIGFRHPSDEGGVDCEPGWWSQNGWVHGFTNEQWPCINIPWRYLKKNAEPEDCLTRELVHPFLAVRNLRDHDPLWVEGVCRLMSLPLYDTMGIHEVGRRRYQDYWSLAWNGPALSDQDYAGRLVRWCRRKKIDPRDSRQLSKALPELWNMNFASALGQPLKNPRGDTAPE
jgi:hypothetical protein